MKDKTILGLGSIAAIAGLELYALSQGLDGAIFTTVIAVIAGIGGYITGKKLTSN